MLASGLPWQQFHNCYGNIQTNDDARREGQDWGIELARPGMRDTVKGRHWRKVRETTGPKFGLLDFSRRENFSVWNAHNGARKGYLPSFRPVFERQNSTKDGNPEFDLSQPEGCCERRVPWCLSLVVVMLLINLVDATKLILSPCQCRHASFLKGEPAHPA